jgi:hypothetical protein
MVRVTKQYVLQNGMHDKTERVTKRYMLQNGTYYKMVTLQNGNVTKRYALQNGMLQNYNRYKTVRYFTVLVTKQYNTLSCNCSPPNPWISV